MTYNVPISRATIGSLDDFPFLRPSDFMKTMCATNDFTRLLGDKSLADSRKTLSLFWSRYREHQPLHDVFTNKNHCLDRCVPMYVHGDEGQTYKKKAVLIISFQSALGTGGRHSPNEHPSGSSVSSAGIPMNFLRNALQTRYLSAVCPKDCIYIIPPTFTYIHNIPIYMFYIYI